MNTSLWSSMCVWFWIIENFFENFCDACEKILVLKSEGIDYVLSTAVFIEFWCDVLLSLLLSWDASIYRLATEL